MALFDLEMIKATYAKFPARVAQARALFNRPLTLTEKILYTHLWENNFPAQPADANKLPYPQRYIATTLFRQKQVQNQTLPMHLM